MWPRLVPPRACRTLCAITLTDGTSEGGAPNVVATMELPCNWQDKPRQIMDVEKHLIQLSGTALFDGDIAPEVDILAGTVEIYGKSWIIYRGGKCRNPDGTVKVILDVSREHAITCTDLADIFAEDEKIKAFRL